MSNTLRQKYFPFRRFSREGIGNEKSLNITTGYHSSFVEGVVVCVAVVSFPRAWEAREGIEREKEPKNIYLFAHTAEIMRTFFSCTFYFRFPPISQQLPPFCAFSIAEYYAMLRFCLFRLPVSATFPVLCQLPLCLPTPPSYKEKNIDRTFIFLVRAFATLQTRSSLCRVASRSRLWDR